MLIFTLYLGFSSPPVLGAILAFFLGYLVDLFSGNTFGLYTFSRPLLFYGAYLFKSKFYWKGFSSQFIFVFFRPFLEGSPPPCFLPCSVRNRFLISIPSSFFSLFPQSTVTALITPLLFALSPKGSILCRKEWGQHPGERIGHG